MVQRRFRRREVQKQIPVEEGDEVAVQEIERNLTPAADTEDFFIKGSFCEVSHIQYSETQQVKVVISNI